MEDYDSNILVNLELSDFQKTVISFLRENNWSKMVNELKQKKRLLEFYYCDFLFKGVNFFG